MELIVPCHFGLETILKREIIDLGYDISKVEDGRVTFHGDEDAVCRANIFLRSAERILIKVGSFHAETFDDLFEGTKALPWEAFIPADGKFWVTKAASVKSKLFSPSDIQSIMKKASRFNRKGPASAKRIQKNPVFIPRSQHDQRRRQIFRNRRLCRQFPIASFM